MTHNHPAGAGFTLDDLLLAVRADLRQLRVVAAAPGEPAWSYVLTRPDEGWGVQAQELDAWWCEGLARVRAWGASLRGPDPNVNHLVARYVARRFGWPYARSLVACAYSDQRRVECP